MGERGIRFFHSYLEASEKLEYFIAGLCIALLGYLSPQFKVIELGLNSSTIEFLSLVSIFVAALAATRRISLNIEAVAAMSHQTTAEESAGSLIAAATSSKVAVNEVSGEVMNSTQMFAKAKYEREKSAAIAAHIKTIAHRLSVLVYFRNTAFFLGLALLVLSRIKWR